MTPPTILFVHGWGFGPEVWDGVHSHLADLPTVAIDLGYRGRADVAPIDGPLVAVGHSLGFLWLLRQGIAAERLVAVNGFPRFTASDGYPGVPGRLLDRMIDRIGQHPEAVQVDFLRRCGVAAPQVDGFSTEALTAGLRALADWDERPALALQAHKVTALCGRADPIVPEAMSQAGFMGSEMSWLDGGHLLPLTHADEVAATVRAALAPFVP